ncbi:MAG: NADP-dependent oxidoreductase [Sphingomonadales bacterium]|jgi:NADPH2:quinone reductase
MQALYYKSYGGADVMYFDKVHKTKPRADEVGVRIHAAGVNPVDWKIREGALDAAFKCEFPVIPGFDLAGVVDRIGDDVTHLKVGDQVFGYVRHDVVHVGTYADYGCFKADQLAVLPEALSFEEGASIPIPALTVWQALLEVAGVAPGQTVLIHGGAGGVGTFAVQVATQHGAKVISTASEANLNHVLGLGAARAFNYESDTLWEDLVRAAPAGYDVIWDSVGGKTLENSYALGRKNGVLISLNERPLDAICEARGIRAHLAHARPHAQQLGIVARLIADKSLVLPPIKVMPFVEAVEALNQSQSGHMRGKIVLKME